jgi:CrcB protein
MVTALLLALAGAVGAVARYGVDSWATKRLGSRDPWGTLIVNITGSFVLGLAAGALPAGQLLLVGVGFCGGYTTFSTASVQVARLMRDGRVAEAAASAAGMLVACMAAAALGVWLAETFLPAPV